MLRSQIARVALLLLPNVRLSSLAIMQDGFMMARDHIRRQYGAIDVLPAADKFDVVSVRRCSLDGKPVQSACGQRVEVDGAVGTYDCDIVILCDFDAQTMATNDWMPLLSPWLCRQAQCGTVIAASGHATMLLAQSGIVDGRTIAVPIAMANGSFDKVTIDFERAFIVDGHIISSRGGLADFTAALYLVESITSRNVGRWLATQWGIEGYGAAASDPLMVRVEAYLQENFSRPLTVAHLAQKLGVNRRTLHRRCLAATGLSPLAYLHHIRVEAARNMLARTSFSIERIAGLIGYSDTGHFRALFRNATGKSPREWRRTVRQSQP